MAGIPLDDEFNGSALRAARRQHKLTQLTLAQRARTSQNHVSQIESGAKQPSAEVAERLAKAVGLDLADLLLASNDQVAS